jgi:hypothetical protein
LIASSTAARVAALTPERPLMTRDTVIDDMPARLATSTIVAPRPTCCDLAMLFLMRSHFDQPT